MGRLVSPADWLGPLFYPPVALVAVMAGGDRIEVWPPEDESDSGGFCGLLLTGRGAGDASCLWDRTKIERVEPPNEQDRQTGWLSTL